jgi:myosin V
VCVCVCVCVKVAYEVKNFLEKNRDTLQPDLLSVILASSSAFVRDLFLAPGQDPAKRLTVGANFKNQLGTLMQILSSTYAHYVRCLKPNMQQRSDTFDGELVLAQLRYYDRPVVALAHVSRTGTVAHVLFAYV